MIMKNKNIIYIALIGALVFVVGCGRAPKEVQSKEVKAPVKKVEKTLDLIETKKKEVIKSTDYQEIAEYVSEQIVESEKKEYKKESSQEVAFLEPQFCSDIGLINRQGCGICEEIDGAVCVSSRKTTDGKQCFECGEKQQSCSDIGLLSEEQCSICDEIPGTECISSTAKSINDCFQCVDEKSVKDIQPKEESSITIYEEASGEDVKPPEEIVSIEEEVLLKEVREPPEEIVSIEEEVLLKEVKEPLEEMVNIDKAIEEIRTKINDLQELAINEEPEETCSNLEFYDKSQCELHCPDCKLADKLSSGKECYQCKVAKGDYECVSNGYHDDCYSCGYSEKCAEVGVVLYYEDQSMQPLTCYSCFEA